MFGHKANMQLVVVQEDVISCEAAAGIKPRLFISFVCHVQKDFIQKRTEKLNPNAAVI